MRWEEAIGKLSKVVEEHQVAVGDRIEAFGKEVSVFKIREQAEIEHHADAQENTAAPLRAAFMNAPAPVIVAADGEEQKQNKHAAGLKIKEEADKQQVDGAPLIDLINKRVEEKNKKKEAPEKELCKQQRFILGVSEYVVDESDR